MAKKFYAVIYGERIVDGQRQVVKGVFPASDFQKTWVEVSGGFHKGFNFRSEAQTYFDEETKRRRQEEELYDLSQDDIGEVSDDLSDDLSDGHSCDDNVSLLRSFIPHLTPVFRPPSTTDDPVPPSKKARSESPSVHSEIQIHPVPKFIVSSDVTGAPKKMMRPF
ncbi:hypothetical protein RCL1_005532 [Eukaryota sp. TZLM3-RCL]